MRQLSRAWPCLLTPCLLTLCIECSVAGQPQPQPACSAGAKSGALSSVHAISDRPGFWRVPIHSRQDDAAYGCLGADRDYKVSFHDGFVFYPVLGTSYPENLPWRWTTVAVTSGGHPIADPRFPDHVHTESRYEYLSPGVVEAYELRSDGVEQTFTIASRPKTGGDLVVEGRIATSLSPVNPVTIPTHAELLFADRAGNQIIRYGKAFAVDARGRCTEVLTSLVAQTVRLTVPGDWLAQATYPVIIDPLTARVPIAFNNNAAANFTAIRREEVSGTYNTMIAVQRNVSGGDNDVYEYLASDDLSLAFMVFADVNSNESALTPDVAAASGFWVICYANHTATTDDVRLHRSVFSALGFDGTVSKVVSTNGYHYSFPRIGGAAATNPYPQASDVMIVCRADSVFGNTASSFVNAIAYNPAANNVIGQLRISSAIYDAESPSIQAQLGPNDFDWIIAYAAKSGAQPNYRTMVTRLNPTIIGWTAPPVMIGPLAQPGDHVRPVVDGRGGRYMVAMLQDVTPETNGRYFARNVYAQRFDWASWSSGAIALPENLVATASNQDLTQLGLAYDSTTASHWCLCYHHDLHTLAHAHAVRLGSTAGVTERADLDGGQFNRFDSAVCYNPRRREFALVYCVAESSWGVYSQFLQYPATAVNSVFGTACGPGIIASSTPPLAGSLFYDVALSNAPVNQPAALWLGTGPGNVDLGPVGAAGCTLYLASITVALPFYTGSAGGYTFRTSLPDLPLITGDLYWQFAYGWPASPNPLQLGATRGLQTAIR